ncbi:dihydrolipoamide acetyltransferase component of pyruvate dehydrogenase complex [Haematococcus lacustris]|uniref:Dihydrolipoamide acetyltransferase component of pyruvate dehydrogenase complex n=2 Tax=Haematococcus lacustris TaxID=44745 RepID=A0A699YVN1_HAELA|nr:dihydrolipoamide acetyltransferase component of pyruvate dehydrogenase complex [Haematococcus lacustris]
MPLGLGEGCAVVTYPQRDIRMQASMKNAQLSQAGQASARRCPLVSSHRPSPTATRAVKEVFMPALSSTMTEGKVVSWLKNVGDKVKKGEVKFPRRHGRSPTALPH